MTTICHYLMTVAILTRSSPHAFQLKSPVFLLLPVFYIEVMSAEKDILYNFEMRATKAVKTIEFSSTDVFLQGGH